MMANLSIKVSVIIPYFQRKPGILRRALNSVLSQELPASVAVHVIVVDDGAPIPASGEIEGLSFATPFTLKLITQNNAGVGAARNAGLDSVEPDTDFIAFLDSDDIWRPKHLATALGAMSEGIDFYFCDHARKGFHKSYFAACSPVLLSFARKTAGDYTFIARDDAMHAILAEFPCQASTTLFRPSLCPDLRFDTRFRYAGEDVLFFTRLAAAASKIGFRNEVLVECADGVNLYFGNFGWDNPKRIPIACDQIAAYTEILQTVPLNRETAGWLAGFVSSYKDDFVFLCLRTFVKKRRWPPEMAQMAANQAWFPAWFAARAVKIAFLKPIGLYRPK